MMVARKWKLREFVNEGMILEHPKDPVLMPYAHVLLSIRCCDVPLVARQHGQSGFVIERWEKAGI